MSINVEKKPIKLSGWTDGRLWEKINARLKLTDGWMPLSEKL